VICKRLDPPIPLVTPRGHALAYFLIDESRDTDLLWVCFMEDTRQCWTFRNPEIRLNWNWTQGLGRKPDQAFPMQPEEKRELATR